MKRRLIVIGTAIVAVAAFAAASLLYKPAPPPQVAAPVSPPEGRQLVRTHSPVMGPANAPVTIVEFFDPACEACRAFYPIVKQILAAYPQDVRLVFRYTLFHRGSDEAAKILEAARIQGLFEPVLFAMLAAQPTWAMRGAPDLSKAWEAAGKAGLDLTKARRDIAAPAMDAILKQDAADSRQFGVNRTPTFYVNGNTLQSFGPQQLYELVSTEVAKSRSAKR